MQASELHLIIPHFSVDFLHLLLNQAQLLLFCLHLFKIFIDTNLLSSSVFFLLHLEELFPLLDLFNVVVVVLLSDILLEVIDLQDMLE